LDYCIEILLLLTKSLVKQLLLQVLLERNVNTCTRLCFIVCNKWQRPVNTQTCFSLRMKDLGV